MLMIKAFHIIAMVAWFAGLFYLPRLFVYHADDLHNRHFKKMESRLYYGITWPSALLTTLLGFALIVLNPYYLKAGWLHTKLLFVSFLWIYHFSCGHFLKRFAKDKNEKSALFFRFFNEIPTLLLIVIVLLAVLKPSSF